MDKVQAATIFVGSIIVFIAIVIMYCIVSMWANIKDWAYRTEKRMYLNGCNKTAVTRIIMSILYHIGRY